MDTDTQHQTNEEPSIVEAEIVETPEKGEVVNADVNVVMNLEQMIKSTIGNIDHHKNEFRKLNEMITSVLENDSTYQEHAKIAKEAAKVKNATKKELMKQQSVASTVKKAQEIRMELKEWQDSLSDYLREYQRLSGSSEIEGEDGEVRDIVYSARLVKRSTKFK